MFLWAWTWAAKKTGARFYCGPHIRDVLRRKSVQGDVVCRPSRREGRFYPRASPGGRGGRSVRCRKNGRAGGLVPDQIRGEVVRAVRVRGHRGDRLLAGREWRRNARQREAQLAEHHGDSGGPPVDRSRLLVFPQMAGRGDRRQPRTGPDMGAGSGRRFRGARTCRDEVLLQPGRTRD